LEARTEALTALINEGICAEHQRIAAVSELVRAYDLPGEAQTLTHLIQIAPEPWKHRLAEFQIRIRTLVLETQALLRANETVIRGGLRVVNGALESFEEHLGAGR